jgi:hypothetical protein
MGALSAVFSFGDGEVSIVQKLAEPIKTREEAMYSLKEQRRQNRGSIVRSGQILAGMRLNLIADSSVKDAGSEWSNMLRSAALSNQIAEQMMAVSQKERITDPLNHQHLPNELGALVVVAEMGDEEYRTGSVVGLIDPMATTARLKDFRKTYKRVGRDALIAAYEKQRRETKLTNIERFVFRLPKADRDPDSTKSLGRVKFDIGVVDTAEKYEAIADAFQAAVNEIQGVIWAEKPKAASIANIYKDTSAANAAKALSAASEFVRLVGVLVKGNPDKMLSAGEKQGAAVKALSSAKPGKAVLEKIPADHAIFGLVDDPRLSFDRTFKRHGFDELKDALNEAAPGDGSFDGDGKHDSGVDDVAAYETAEDNVRGSSSPAE